MIAIAVHIVFAGVLLLTMHTKHPAPDSKKQNINVVSIGGETSNEKENTENKEATSAH